MPDGVGDRRRGPHRADLADALDTSLRSDLRLLDLTRLLAWPTAVRRRPGRDRYRASQDGPQLCGRLVEPVVIKQFPNAFHNTDLEKTLRNLGSGPDLVPAGFMTHMCVTFTAQGAFNLGYRTTVVAEATATRTLAAPDGTALPAAALQAAALTTLGDLFGLVAPRVQDLTA
ncbi:isochorismatase family protein [Streptomyces sp. NPDC037389]|uniref:isochorismatase family protein n=1 Tax=Streptomyces sp. NPDC037389 TaxID=3155369 RepID=UPI0033C978F1